VERADQAEGEKRVGWKRNQILGTRRPENEAGMRASGRVKLAKRAGVADEAKEPPSAY
jgi:hypothetical protein